MNKEKIRQYIIENEISFAVNNRMEVFAVTQFLASINFGKSPWMNDIMTGEWDTLTNVHINSSGRIHGNYTIVARAIKFSEISEFIEKATKSPKPIEVKLNDTHTAIIDKDGITVGCQKFPLSVIDGLVKARKEIQKK